MISNTSALINFGCGNDACSCGDACGCAQGGCKCNSN
uniref:Metallothionein 5 n=1 Tax=Laccaria bicolor TaxID=29883 RepID=A0A0F6MXM3_LACBI|nr:metallothionein 5 [Laccaria bicolor]